MSILDVVCVGDGVGIGAGSDHKSLSLLSSSLLLLKTAFFVCLHVGSVKFVTIAFAELRCCVAVGECGVAVDTVTVVVIGCCSAFVAGLISLMLKYYSKNF